MFVYPKLVYQSKSAYFKYEYNLLLEIWLMMID